MNEIFDSHFHIIDYRFPVSPNQGYTPTEFSCEDYLKIARPLGITGGAVVSGSFQKYDQTYLLATLEKLGKNFVGVTQLPNDTPDQKILELNQQGIRAIRFNLKRGVTDKLDAIRDFALRVYHLVGWHAEFYVELSNMPEICDILLQLPKYSIDHLGMNEASQPFLINLVENGAYVKADGFGRVELDVIDVMKKCLTINPNCLMFGTDLPSTRAKRPFEANDIELIKDNFSKEICQQIFYENAMTFYQFKSD